jgi:hypothetical protein
VKIPLVGPGLSFLVHIFGMGCLLVHLRNLYMRRRDSTDSPTGEPGVLATG